MTEVRELTLQEIDAVSGGRDTVVDIDLGFMSMMIDAKGPCYGWAIQFMNTPGTPHGGKCQ